MDALALVDPAVVEAPESARLGSSGETCRKLKTCSLARDFSSPIERHRMRRRLPASSACLRARLHDVEVLGAVVEGVDALSIPPGCPRDEFKPISCTCGLGTRSSPELLVVFTWTSKAADWEERLAGEMQQDGRVLADRVEHHRTLELGHDLTHDVDGFGFQLLEMRQPEFVGECRYGRGVMAC